MKGLKHFHDFFCSPKNSKLFFLQLVLNYKTIIFKKALNYIYRIIFKKALNYIYGIIFKKALNYIYGIIFKKALNYIYGIIFKKALNYIYGIIFKKALNYIYGICVIWWVLRRTKELYVLFVLTYEELWSDPEII